MSVTSSSIRGVDFHCHVDLHQDPPGLIAACERERIVTLAVTTTPRAWPQNREWTAASRYVHAAVGLHPELVGERGDEIGLLEEFIGEARLVGEIGLDGSPQHRNSWDSQREVFVRALRRAQELGGRVVSIHSRRAADETIRLVAEHTTPDRVLPVLHWFSGSQSAATRAVAHGCYFSINQRMLEHKAGLSLVRKLPLDRLLTETDSPFTTQGNRPSKPSDTRATAQSLALARDAHGSELSGAIAENSNSVLQFAGKVLP